MITITAGVTKQYLVPVVNVPQTFSISLAGYPYQLTCKWNDSQDSGWIIDIADGNTGVMLAAGLPLITGTDVLDGLEYLGINGSLIVYTNGYPYAVPTLTNLGVDCNLYFLTNSSG